MKFTLAIVGAVLAAVIYFYPWQLLAFSLSCGFVFITGGIVNAVHMYQGRDDVFSAWWYVAIIPAFAGSIAICIWQPVGWFGAVLSAVIGHLLYHSSLFQEVEPVA